MTDPDIKVEERREAGPAVNGGVPRKREGPFARLVIGFFSQFSLIPDVVASTQSFFIAQ
jgi:hypothetical protein